MLRTIARQGSIVAVLLLATASVAFGAAGGGRSSSSSISLMLMAAPAASAASADPSYGQSVSFAVSTNATSQPFVHVRCSQNGALVYEDWQNWAFSDHMFNLGGTTAWQGGAADCSASLENWDSYSKNGKITVLASTNFHVNA